jgi:hypothetical protein
MGEVMNELLDLKSFWDKCVQVWKEAFAVVFFSFVFYFVGAAVAQKNIIEDCKFAGVFRDGHQPYTCQAVVRVPR